MDKLEILEGVPSAEPLDNEVVQETMSGSMENSRLQSRTEETDGETE